ncbi:MAG: hypothetical protein KKH51_10390 [Actinobacteria bacterium]|nr:hypothetical protein [Actinomycetota bacterium]
MSSDATTERPQGLSFLRKHTEVIIAILLGVVSIATAYASFQSSLYGGQQAQAYTVGTNLSTEAESLYLENNQTFVQNSQLWQTLTELRLDIANPDPAISEAAQIKYDTIYFQSVSDDFGAAIERADAENEANPDFYVDPSDDEDYQASLFTEYADTKDKADKTIKEGDLANTYGDRDTLATVIMAVSLFLLGIAAVVTAYRVKLIMGAVAVAIFVVAIVIAAAVPQLPLF